MANDISYTYKKENYIFVLGNGVPSQTDLNGIFAFDQAKALHRAGYNVIYAALDLRSFRHKRNWGISSGESEGMRIYNLSFPIGRVPSRLMAIFSRHHFDRLFKYIIKENGLPRFVHAHCGRGRNYLCCIKKKYGVEYIVTEHDSLVEQDKVSAFERKNLRRIYAGALNRIAVSSAFAERLQSLYDMPFDVIYNVLDMRSFGSVEKVKHDGFNFVSVGNLLDGKGFVTLIDAFSRIAFDAKLYIIGSGPMDKVLNELIFELNLKDKVFLVGQKSRNEIAEYLSKSDCFVLASKKETFGVVYIEAMACGLPIIATKCGGPQDFVNEYNGILVDVDDVSGLRDAMRYMIVNRNNYNDAEIRQLCMDAFSDKAFSDRFCRLMGESIMNDVRS